MTRRNEMLCAAALALAATVLAGCIKPPTQRVSLDRLVGEYNDNAAKVRTLWARARIKVKIVDEKGRAWRWGSTSPLAASNGLLLLSKTDEPRGPQNFAIYARELGVDLFRVGSSADEGVYYLWYSLGEHRGGWWGRHEFAGAPGIEAVPINPNQLLSVLSVCSLPDDPTRLPAVLLRMSHDPFAYVLTYVERQAITGRILATREVHFTWDDRKARRPFLVKLLDADGEVVMVARLKDYRPIETVEPTDTPPVMPTDIEITWPKSDNRIHLLLSKMTDDADKWDVEACRFRHAETGDLPGGLSPLDVIQVDRGLETTGESNR